MTKSRLQELEQGKKLTLHDKTLAMKEVCLLLCIAQRFGAGAGAAGAAAAAAAVVH